MSLRRSFARLAPSARELLLAMAAAGPWSVTTASDHTGRPLCDVARDVHALLLHGHVRRIDASAGPHFVVLRPARRIAQEQWRADRLAASVSSIDRRIPVARPTHEQSAWGEFVIDGHHTAHPGRSRNRAGTAPAGAGRRSALSTAEAM